MWEVVRAGRRQECSPVGGCRPLGGDVVEGMQVEPEGVGFHDLDSL